MKRIAALLMALLLVFSLAACNNTPTSQNGGDKLSVVCSTFPIYDWARNIIGDAGGNIDLTLLLDNGIDLHNYQATADDIITIHNCDLFVYVGGESDNWVKDVISEAANDKMLTLSLVESIGSLAKEEEEIEGMQADEDEMDEEPQADEHVWLSLQNAGVLVDALTEAICAVDEANNEKYINNAKEYKSQLDELDKQFKAAVKEGKQNTIVFGDRFPFRYLMDDYGLKYFAAFAGCSAETEASFETISFLANKVDELSLNAVVAIDGSDGKIAQTIADTASRNPSIIFMNSMQAITSADIENGMTYLKAMTDNLQALKDALV